MLRDPPELAAQLAGANMEARTQSITRNAIQQARIKAFRHLPVHEILRTLLADANLSAEIESLPPLSAVLLSVSAAEAEHALEALKRSARAADSMIVGAYWNGTVSTPSELPKNSVQSTAPASPGITLALIDSGVDATHPLLRDALGHFYFREGTPGEFSDRRVLRSHGTAMLGIYAQAALGLPLRSGDTWLPKVWDKRPFRIAATLVAEAGPETAAGRAAFARGLAWLLDPTRGHPLPDIINYSQGNGRLCASTTTTCETWSGVTRLLDRAADELAIVVVKSAGNEGFGTENTMTVPGESFQAITVGNMHPFDWHTCAPNGQRAAHKIYRNSSTGPLHGPRLLDLVAPGVHITTSGVDDHYCRAVCGQSGKPSCQFCARLGTHSSEALGPSKENTGSSPAAAVVGAVAAQLIASGIRDPLRIKAILLNSADSWSSGHAPSPRATYRDPSCGEDAAATAHGPFRQGSRYDRVYGWGYLNGVRAISQAHASVSNMVTSSRPRCYQTFLKPFQKITLVWSRTVARDGTRWRRVAPLSLELLVAAPPYELLDFDPSAHAADNVRQVANGRGALAVPNAREIIARITLEKGFHSSRPFALAGPRPLAVVNCPSTP